MLLSRKRKKAKIKQNFQRYSQEKFHAFILLASSLATQVYKPIDLQQFLEQKVRTKHTKKKKH